MSSEISEDNPSLAFIFEDDSDGRVLVKSRERSIPPASELARYGMISACGGTSRLEGCDMWALAAPGASFEDSAFTSRRELTAICGRDIFVRSGIAYQVMRLHEKNKYCGACGNLMADHETDLARYCASCGNIAYPALSSAVIVAVERDGRLLLGHNVNFPSGRYSVLAGFVEPGETLEEAAAREVREESGVTVRNIRYFGSQPWPFPNSMMLGFKADWESGEPTPDGRELSDVRFFSRDELPDLPPGISISRRLIEDWRSRSTSSSPLA